MTSHTNRMKDYINVFVLQSSLPSMLTGDVVVQQKTINHIFDCFTFHM